MCIRDSGIASPNVCEEAVKKYKSAAAGKFNLVLGSKMSIIKNWILTVPEVAFAIWNMLIAKTVVWQY